MAVSDQELQLLTVRVGAGDHDAFRRLHGLLAPATLAAVRADLPEMTHAMPVVRSAFCEVWWMCAFHARHGAPRTDIPQWIAGIAQRRGAERRAVLDLIATRGQLDRSAFWVDAIADDDSRTGFDLALMLDGHDTIRLPPETGTSGRSAAPVDSAARA